MFASRRLNSRHTAICIAVATTLIASGCATGNHKDNTDRVDAQNKALTDLIPQARPIVVHENDAPFDITPLPAAKQTAIERAWLRSKKVDFLPNKKNPSPIPANEILKMFRENGVNITSALPLENYSYNGNGVKGVDGETALQMILGQMGLDYETDEKGKFVTVVPMASKSWNINLGNRTSHSTNTSFESICNLTGSGGSASASAAPSAAPAASAMPSPMGGMPGQSAQAGGSAGGGSTAGSSVSTQENFWAMLSTELAQRLQVLIPTNALTATPVGGANVPQVPAFQAQQGAAGTGGTALYTKQQIGHFSVNPVTGNVTIQAPAWLLKQIDSYMGDVIMPMFNTSLTFEGTVVNVRSSSDKTTGFDLSALATYAGKFGFVLNNNILGGISMGTVNGVTTATYGGASNLPGGGAAFGLKSSADNLQIFNAFLTTLGGTEILNRPVVTVTSGVPVDFGRLTPIYTNEQTQTVTPGSINANATITIQNNVIRHQYGSLLRIMPHYDPQTKRVRAQVSLLQLPLVGYQILPLAMIGVSGAIQYQNIRKPQIECGVTSTEAILDDGELIIVGGQIENTLDNTHAGVTGLMDVPGVDLLTSQRRDTGTRTTMYFALRVRLNTKK